MNITLDSEGHLDCYALLKLDIEGPGWILNISIFFARLTQL